MKNSRLLNNSTCRFKSGAIIIGVYAVFFFLSVSYAQQETTSTGGDTADTAKVLKTIRLGSMADFSRLIFTFDAPIQSYTVRRAEVDEIWIDFGDISPERQGLLDMTDKVVEGVAITRQEKSLTARIKITRTRFNFRHFTSSDRLDVVIDLKPIIMTGEEEAEQRKINIPPGFSLEPPPLKKTAESIRARLPKTPKPETDIAMMVDILDNLSQENYAPAIELLENFKIQFPESNLWDPAIFLLGDAYFNKDKEDFASNFIKTTSAYQQGLNMYPGSPQAPRAALMRAVSYMKMDYVTEALGYFKLVVKDYPESPYAITAQVYMGDLYMMLGKFQLARAAYDAVIAQGYNQNFVLDHYSNLGVTYYHDGLFSKANEIFKEIMDASPSYYLRKPDLLFYMGEGYYNLKRPDLSSAFLYHFINLKPESEYADLALTRIGDIYKDRKDDRQAIEMYGLIRDIHPGTTGALVSQMRLADFGALRSIFEPNAIFNALEEGSHEATLKMYKAIVEAEEDSPLVELAMFKIGVAYYSQEEQPQAIQAFKDAMDRFPNGALKDDIIVWLNKALLAEFQNLLDQSKYVEIIALYADNKQLVDDESWPKIRDYLARAYDQLGFPEQAALLWEANEGLTDAEDERILGLGRAYLKMGKYNDAVKMFERFRKEFPDNPRYVESIVDQARAMLGLNDSNEAVNLLEQAVSSGREMPTSENVYYLLGRMYIDNRQLYKGTIALEKAIEQMNETKASNDDLFLAYSQLGRTYTTLGQLKKAAAALDAAVNIKPRRPFPETVYLIAQSYKQLDLMDKYEETLKLLEKERSGFWKDVASEDIRALTPDEKVEKLLSTDSNS